MVEGRFNAKSLMWMIEYAHTLTEGAGAASPAAVYQIREQLRGEKIGLICSGGNSSLAHLEQTLTAVHASSTSR